MWLISIVSPNNLNKQKSIKNLHHSQFGWILNVMPKKCHKINPNIYRFKTDLFIWMCPDDIDGFLHAWHKYVIKRGKKTNSRDRKSIGFQSFSIVNCSLAMIWLKKIYWQITDNWDESNEKNLIMVACLVTNCQRTQSMKYFYYEYIFHTVHSHT